MTAVVLGFQRGRTGTGERLSRLNARLATRLAAPGLLDYQVLRHQRDTERFCVYWLWRDWADRDALFAAPPAPLTEFQAAARPLWTDEPAIAGYRWADGDDRPPCSPGRPVAFLPIDAPGRSGRVLLDLGSGLPALRCRTDQGADSWRPVTPEGNDLT